MYESSKIVLIWRHIAFYHLNDGFFSFLIKFFCFFQVVMTLMSVHSYFVSIFFSLIALQFGDKVKIEVGHFEASVRLNEMWKKTEICCSWRKTKSIFIKRCKILYFHSKNRNADEFFVFDENSHCHNHPKVKKFQENSLQMDQICCFLVETW